MDRIKNLGKYAHKPKMDGKGKVDTRIVPNKKTQPSVPKDGNTGRRG